MRAYPAAFDPAGQCQCPHHRQQPVVLLLGNGSDRIAREASRFDVLSVECAIPTCRGGSLGHDFLDDQSSACARYARLRGFARLSSPRGSIGPSPKTPICSVDAVMCIYDRHSVRQKRIRYGPQRVKRSPHGCSF